MSERVKPARFPWPQMVALSTGAIFFLLGLGGFAVTGFTDFFRHDPVIDALGFTLNPMHNVIHFVLGLVGGICASGLRATMAYGWLLIVAYGAVLVYGLFVTGDPAHDLLNLNWADNVLHLAAVGVGVLIVIGANRIGREDGWVVPRPGAPTPGQSANRG
ncbi:DUF4383 domain-containing protein [Crossiella sp. SN42]|uniref:DUF4383 domain-containing protein n=1 Tax=Crossiella sp. SN42 TaxID=2944808 RepID=UPI00207CEF8D|nr:DUF4383 domain-containing protein [Crossiella sp. SN42]MCO1575459.1 DUF4383 domain-containing protein [Crossiella sp. SN42]